MRHVGENSEHGSKGFHFLLQLYTIVLRALLVNSASLFTLTMGPLNGIL